MSKAVVIFGAGGFGREVIDVIDACNAEAPGSFEVQGFLSELEEDHGCVVQDLPVLGGYAWLERNLEVAVICGIGAPQVRHRVIERCDSLGCGYATVIHPRATMSRWVDLGSGCVITAGVVLTNHITVGAHVHLNLNATVGHDAVIEDFVTIAPGAHVSGRVTIGTGCNIGTGAAVIERMRIGAWSIVGAGAVVTRDLPANVTAVGAPAKVIKERQPDWWRA